ncbi:MAG: glycosyl transferase family protein [Pseudomonadales bacterium]|nr:glycosyl transferase family protein [Pseudomonadales bacterium]
MKTSIPPAHEHPFAQYVRILGKGKKGSRSLTEAEAFDAMDMIMNGQVQDVQLGAFLMLMRVKEESAEELLGFVKAVKQSVKATQSMQVDLDWSSYAGKRRHLPWYLLSVFLLAESGVRVFMHGASGHTIDRIYTEDVLTDLGLPVAQSWNDCSSQLDSHNFTYFPLEHLCPKLHSIIELRNVMGLRSPVHTLSRLLNPCDSEHVIQGIFHPGYRPVHQVAAQALGYQSVDVIKGEAGEIERNPDIDCLVQSVRNGELSDETWPALFSKRHVKEDNLTIEHLVETWQGKREHEYGEAAVIGTTAIALKLLGKAESQPRANEMAQDLWHQRNKTFI